MIFRQLGGRLAVRGAINHVEERRSAEEATGMLRIGGLAIA